MTELIRSQLTIIAVMLSCGIAGGLIHSVFASFEEIKKMKRWGRIFTENLYFLSMGFLYSEFTFYCANGKLSFLGLVSFVMGLRLWKTFFCGILFVGEDNEERQKQRSKES